MFRMTLKTFYQLDNEVENIEFKSCYFDDFNEKHTFYIPRNRNCERATKQQRESPTTEFEIETDKSFDELEQQKERQNEEQIEHFLEEFETLSNRFESVSVVVDQQPGSEASDDFNENAIEVCEGDNLSLPTMSETYKYEDDQAEVFDILEAETRCPHKQWKMSEFVRRLATGDIFVTCDVCGRLYVPNVTE